MVGCDGGGPWLHAMSRAEKRQRPLCLHQVCTLMLVSQHAALWRGFFSSLLGRASGMVFVGVGELTNPEPFTPPGCSTVLDVPTDNL